MVSVDQRFAADTARARLAQHAVAYAFGQRPQAIEAPTRGARAVAFARQTAMYLAHVSFGMSLSRVATAFGRDRSTVAHACQVIEDRRDEPVFDARVEQLEAFLRAAPSPTLDIAP